MFDVRNRCFRVGQALLLREQTRHCLANIGTKCPQTRIALRLRRLQAALILGVGLAAGTVGAMVLGRSLSSLVFEISPWDLRVFLATALLLTVTGLVAAWLPARRASRVEPRITMQEG